MYGIDPEYVSFRLKKMRNFLRKKYGADSLNVLQRIKGYESVPERKKRRSLVLDLRRNGFSLSEIGRLMSLSSQAVSLIIKKQGKYKVKIKKKEEKQAKLF